MGSRRYVSMPALRKSVPLGAYLAGIRVAKANPKAEFKHGLTSWWPCTGEEIMAQFRRGMMDRINAGIPYSERGL